MSLTDQQIEWLDRAVALGTVHEEVAGMLDAADAVANARIHAKQRVIDRALLLLDEWEEYDSEGYAAGDGPDWWSRSDRLRTVLGGGSGV